MRLQWFEYLYQGGSMELHKTSSGPIMPPATLPEWKIDEETRILAVVVRAGEGKQKDATVTVEVSPAILKGWVIYQMETVRLASGGMLNERHAEFHINQLSVNKQVRIDLLIRGPYREATVGLAVGKKKVG